jgi:cysteine desulfurase
MPKCRLAPGIVGFGEACRLAKRELQGEAERVAKLRDKLEQRLFGGTS